MTSRVEVTRVDAQLGSAYNTLGVWTITVQRMTEYNYDPSTKPDAQDIPQDVREGLRRWLNGMEGEAGGDAGAVKL